MYPLSTLANFILTSSNRCMAMPPLSLVEVTFWGNFRGWERCCDLLEAHLFVVARAKYYNDICAYKIESFLQYFMRVSIMLDELGIFFGCVAVFVANRDTCFLVLLETNGDLLHKLLVFAT